MRHSELKPLSQERKVPADLAALRINREPEKARGPRGWLLLAALLVVGAGAAAYFLTGRSLGPRKVETVTASIVTEGQATTLLTATIPVFTLAAWIFTSNTALSTAGAVNVRAASHWSNVPSMVTVPETWN